MSAFTLVQCKKCGTRRVTRRLKNKNVMAVFFCYECYAMNETVIEREATEKEVEKYRYPINQQKIT